MSTVFSAVTRAVTVLAIATLLLPAPAVSQEPERRPMTVEDVRRMVEQGVRPQTILAALRQNCLAVYGLNDAMQRELAEAGAEPELLEGLRQVCWGAPGGPVMDPTQPFVVITEPAEWTPDAPRTLPVAAGQSIRVQGLVHAPAGVDRLTINGEPVRLVNDPAGGVRFSSSITVRAGMRVVDLTLHPEEGESYRKTLPLTVAAATPTTTPTTTNVVRQPYNPGSVAASGILPGVAQFRTGNTGLGIVVLGSAVGAAAAGMLSTETVVRCGADADPCPDNAILSEETERPLLVPGLAAAAGITALGAILGYNAAKAANERAARRGGLDEDAATRRMGQLLLERLPTPTASGGWAVELGRFHF